MTMISSAAAGACLEEARCLTGAGSYIMFGSCGLNRGSRQEKSLFPPRHTGMKGFPTIMRLLPTILR